MKNLFGNWGSDLQARHEQCLFCTASAAEELVFRFPSGHGFSHAASSASSIRLQPLRPAFAALFRRLGLLGLREYPRFSLGHGFTACRKSLFSIGGRSFSSDIKYLTITGLLPLKKCWPLYSRRLLSDVVTFDEGPK
jgi:hypothetical protein